MTRSLAAGHPITVAAGRRHGRRPAGRPAGRHHLRSHPGVRRRDRHRRRRCDHPTPCAGSSIAPGWWPSRAGRRRWRRRSPAASTSWSRDGASAAATRRRPRRGRHQRRQRGRPRHSAGTSRSARHVMSQREPLLDRFIRYAKIDTQSSDTSTTYPSTEKQKDLLRVLVDDLKAAGLADAAMDEWGYVMATLPVERAGRSRGARQGADNRPHRARRHVLRRHRRQRQPAGPPQLRRRGHRAARRSGAGHPRGRRDRRSRAARA